MQNTEDTMDQKLSAPSLKTCSAGRSIVSTETPAFTPRVADYLGFLHKLPRSRSVPAGTLLVEQGCTTGSVQLIETGLVKLVHLSARGREVTTGLRSNGWYAGASSALLGMSSIYSVRTVTACRVCRIPAETFARRLEELPEMLEHFLNGLCFEVASQASLYAEVLSGSAEDRLDHFLRERAIVGASRKTLDPLPALKQMEVAQLLSITPEHLCRLLQKKRSGSCRRLAVPKERQPQARPAVSSL